FARHPKFLDRTRVQAPGSVEIDTRPVPRTRRAVADVAVAVAVAVPVAVAVAGAVGQSLEEGARLCRKRMLAAVAGTVDPPDLPRRLPGGQCMKHGQHRGCADAGTQQDDGSAAWSQREATAWRAH